LVILDEPTANLDPLGRYNVLTKIKRLRDENNMNFLISTHILSELEKVCDNVVILNEGKVLAYGSYNGLVAKYSTLKYTVKVDNPKSFIESLPTTITERVEVKDDSILVEVEDEAYFLKEFNEAIRSKNFTLKELKICTPTLEDIFIEAMRRRQFD
jgi:ABC-2 type transport system ATP-binding protein